MTNPNNKPSRVGNWLSENGPKIAALIGVPALALTGCTAPQPAPETPVVTATSPANVPSATPSATKTANAPTPSASKSEKVTPQAWEYVKPITIDKDNETQNSFIEQLKLMPILPEEIELADPTNQKKGNEATLTLSDNNKVITLESKNNTFKSTTIFTDEASTGEGEMDKTIVYSITWRSSPKDVLNASFTYVKKSSILNSDKKSLVSQVKEVIKEVDNNGKTDKLGNKSKPETIVLDQSADLKGEYYGKLFFQGGNDKRATSGDLSVFLNYKDNTTGNSYSPNTEEGVRNLDQKEMRAFQSNLIKIAQSNGAAGGASLVVGYNPAFSYTDMKGLYQGFNEFIAKK